ncbi:MAG: SDR family NAD(P)-dependent oxidoreductase, partial [Bacteroidota bacterium]
MTITKHLDKVAVITGGNGTLGNAFVRALAECGARVFILGRNAEKSAAVVTSFQEEGLTVEAVTCDVLDEGAVAGAVEEILEKAG